MMHVKSPTFLAFLAAAAAALLSTAAWAGWTRQGDAAASFKATGPAGLKIVGTAPSLEVKDDGKDFTVVVKLADVDTDNSLRNRHMLEDLEAEKFPLATLTVPVETVKEGADVEARGSFTMHGKTREVPFRYTSKCSGGVCQVEGSADLNLKDFDIKIRSYLGITVKSEISVTTKFQMKR